MKAFDLYQKLMKNQHRWLHFIIIIFLGLFVGRFLISSDIYKDILWIFIFFIIIFLTVYGLRYILFLLVPISIVSRGVFNLIGDLTIWDALLILVSVVGITKTLMKKPKLRFSKEGKAFFLLLVIIVLTQIMGFFYFRELFAFASLKPFLSLLEGILVFICVIIFVRNPQDIKILITVLICTGFALALITIYESNYGTFFFGEGSIFSSTYSSFRGELKINPSFILLFLSAFWLSVIFSKGKPYIYMVILVILYAIILSSSRSLYFGILGGLIGLLYLRRFSTIILTFSIISFIIWFTADFFIPKVSEVTTTILSYFGKGYIGWSSTYGRLILAKVAIENFLSHPLWGFGINGFGMETYTNPYYINKIELMDEFIGFFGWFGTPAGDTHNQYLQILADHGLIAFLLFLYILIKLLKFSYQNCLSVTDKYIKNVSHAIFLSLTGLLFSFLGAPLITSMANITSMTSFGVSVGLIYSIKKMNKGNEEERRRDDVRILKR